MAPKTRLILAGILAGIAGSATAASFVEGPAVAGPAIPEALSRQELQPRSLASADFDGDGVPDLAAGFATSEGGAVVLYRGDADALYPHSPEARQRQAQGGVVGAPFLPTDRVLALAAPPDFLFAGDFDADGNVDLAVATRGGTTIGLHRGDGRGGFREPEAIEVSGQIIGLAAGDIGQRDGLADLVVAVDGDSGPRALIYQGPSGALRAGAVAFDLDEPPAAVSIDPESSAISLDGSSGAWRLERVERAWRLADPGEASPRHTAALRPDDAAATLAMRVGSNAGGGVVLRSDGALTIFAPAIAATFVVNVTTDLSDAAPGNGICADVNGQCSLRAAIQESNANPGFDVITFAIPGAGVPAIATPSLPAATEAVTIDGTTQAAGRVVVTGTSNGTLLTLSGGSSVVHGLVLNGSGNFGLRIQSSDNVVEGNFFGTTADGTAIQGSIAGPNIIVSSGTNNRIGATTALARNVVASGSLGIRLDGGTTVIEGNYIGTDVTGSLDLGSSGAGIRAFTAANNTIGGAAVGAGNLVSGHQADGILLDSGGNLVQGNRVGTNAAGTLALPNATFGVHVSFSADNVIGGTAPGAGNLISGNGNTGLQLDAGGIEPIVNTLVQGNRIGTNADGTAAIPNVGRGIAIVGGTNVTIGGALAGARNLVSGNLQDGIFLTKFSTVYPTGTLIRGNFIGTDATGTVAIPNLQSGIAFEYALGTLVGGSAAGEGNVISGNHDHGILFGGITDASANPNFVRGNLIGSNAFGSGALGNGRSGAFFGVATPGYELGGSGADANLIAFNGGDGIASAASRRIRFRINSVHSNGGLAVDRYDDGVTPNQPPGTFVDQNFPILTAASTSVAGTNVSGTLTSGYALAYTIHVFASPLCDASGYGEARQYLGSTTVNTTANAATPFSAVLPTPAAAGSYITALAVAPDDAAHGAASSELSFCRQVGGTPPPGSVPLALYAAVPARGGNTGFATIHVAGQGILAGASVRLERSGQPDRVGTGVVVSPDGASVTATLPLSGAALGAWDVVVTNPGNATATLTAAYAIEAGVAAAPWADILGRGTLAVRAGREQTFFLVYGNSGNVDAAPTEFRVTVPWQLQVTHVESIRGSRPVVQVDRPMLTGRTGETSIVFILPSIPASSSAALGFRVKTIAAEPGEFGERVQFRVWLMTTPGLSFVFDDPPNPAVTATPTILIDTPTQLQASIHVSDGVTSGDLLFDMNVSSVTFEADPVVTKSVDGDQVTYSFAVALRDAASTLAAGVAGRTRVQSPLDGGLSSIGGSVSGGAAVAQLLKTLPPGQLTAMLDAATQNIANQFETETGPGSMQNLKDLSESATVLGEVSDLLSGLPQNAPPFEPPSGAIQADVDRQVTDVIKHVEELRRMIEERKHVDWDSLSDEEKSQAVKEVCGSCHSPGNGPLVPLTCPYPGVIRTGHYVIVYEAIDPNEKAGPSGAGDARFVPGDSPFPYTVTFENLETATAAAQEVIVTDQLDGAKLELSSFALGPIAFGTRVLDVPPGLTAFTGDVDLRPGIDLIARVSADFNPATGLATWHFFSIDPATGLPTDDPALGFLPPDVSAPEGEGHVAFTVAAKTGLATGTQIHNQASIVFDANPAIVTADWFNTIDATAPTSQVAAQPGSACAGIAVQWSGADAHSGIAGYDIFVSTNGGPFDAWRLGTTATSGTYYGEVGSSYGFYSVARDNAGNAEAPPAGADAATTVGDPSPLVDSITPDSGPASGATVVITGGVFEPGAAVKVGDLPASGVTVDGPTSLTATFPALPQGALYDVVATNASTCGDVLVKGWFADFGDVPAAHGFHDFIEKIFRRGVTAGCVGGNYCPDNPVTRAQMAVFLVKAKYELLLVPPTATGTLFLDVPTGSFAADWIEQLANEGVTGGCGGGNYCPTASVSRKQMAVFLLKSRNGALYLPPPATGVFADVPPSDPFAPWIEQLAAEGITGGCGAGNYCPNNPVTRGQMAVFLSKTFGF